jgi:hypothetical protein
MATYRLFKLYRSQTDTTGALWRDLGVVDLDLGDDPAAAVSEENGAGEYLFLDETCVTIADKG